MKSNEPFNIDREGKLYKLVTSLHESPFTFWIFTKDVWTEEYNCFSNLCLFLRTFLIFILFLVFSLTVVGYSIYLLFLQVGLSHGLHSSTSVLMTIAVFFKTIFPLSLLVGFICYSTFYVISFVNSRLGNRETTVKKRVYKEKKPNVFIQAIKDRHNKICRSFNIK